MGFRFPRAAAAVGTNHPVELAQALVLPLQLLIPCQSGFCTHSCFTLPCCVHWVDFPSFPSGFQETILTSFSFVLLILPPPLPPPVLQLASHHSLISVNIATKQKLSAQTPFISSPFPPRESVMNWKKMLLRGVRTSSIKHNFLMKTL